MTTALLESFFSPQQVQVMLDDFNSQSRIQEIGQPYVAPDEGRPTEACYDMPSTLPLVPLLEEQLQQVYKRPLVFANTYTRMYTKGSLLRIHTDRPGLDVTVSVGLRRDVPWALHVSHALLDDDWEDCKHLDHSQWMKAYSSYDLHPGDCDHCYGRKNPHWRERLLCEEDQVNIYSFFHWSFK